MAAHPCPRCDAKLTTVGTAYECDWCGQFVPGTFYKDPDMAKIKGKITPAKLKQKAAEEINESKGSAHEKAEPKARKR